MDNSNRDYNKGIIAWFAHNPVAANLLLITTMVLGILSYSDIRKETFPSLAPDRVTISVSYDSGDPTQAEEGIAIKIEEAIEGVAGIDTITSTSNAKGSTVVVEKEEGYPLDTLFDDIKNDIDAINDLPSDSDNPVIEKATREDHAIWVQLYGDADQVTFQGLAERLKSDLLAKPDIRSLDISATEDPVISVELDETKLQAYGLTFSEVSDAINAESSSSTTTSIRNSEKAVRLKVSQQAYQQQEFANIPILTLADGSQIYLGDVANVQDTFEDTTFTLSRYNQQPGMAIEIVMDSRGDITKLVEQAKEVVETWNTSNYLPENVKLTTWYDSSTIIKSRLSLLLKNAMTGIALVFIILALFLNLRVALWVAMGLPFVFFGTLYFMTDSYAGLTINQMTTFGFIMALGIVVDDAVVVGESIYSTRRSDGDTLENTVKGTLKVAVPTVFGVLTTVAAFVAVSNVQGRLGEIYAQFATVVMICLLLSVVESKFILPSHLAHLNTHRGHRKGIWAHIQHGADYGLQWFSKNIYSRAINLALSYRYAVLIIFIALFVLVAAMPLTGKVRISFFPDITGDTVRSSITMYDDASFGQTHSSLMLLEKTALQADAKLIEKYGVADSEIENIQVIAESDDSGNVRIQLDSDSVYSPNELIKEWTRIVGMPEGVKKLNIQSKRSMGDNFKAEIRGWDAETVFAAGEEMKAKLQTIKGVSGVDDNMSPGEPQYRFELTDQGRALGIETSGLASQVLRAFGGSSVQSFQRNSDEVKVRVRYPEAQRKTLADVMETRVRISDGTAVPLSSVANVYNEYQVSEITRIDNLRAVYVSASVDKNIIASNELVQIVKSELLPQLMTEYPNLEIDFAGEAARQEETTSSMGTMFALALIAIYALLAIPLKSYVQPMLIMMAIPFGIVGAILGHVINDLTISILSLNGVLALSGVVVNDSLLLVSTYNEKRKEKGIDVKEAILTACTGRLRAVLLTSVTTFAGLAPLLSETSTQAQFLIPAAASLGYGILFATLITLVLIPSLLLIHHEIYTLIRKGLDKIGFKKTEIVEC